MSALISVSPDYDMSRLRELAGGSAEPMVYRNDCLEIDGIAQAALYNALVLYVAEHARVVIDRAAQAAISAVNAAAGAARLKYLTRSFGQELVYAIKDQHARAFKDAVYAGTVPAFVQAEATATGTSHQAACDAIIALADQWISIGAAIDGARRTAMVQIAAAVTALDQPAITAARDAAIATIMLL
ncbi:MAG: hypothetical protein L0Y38_00335 [Methylococcaceae bacterium]|nr:hypothetical protein [Methylococcaceae bacterium]